jgi:radical SAM protein with 4Fe4S-binding SPASM domain
MAKDNTLQVENGSVPAKLYQKIPCRVGYSYMRLQIDGSSMPCCIADNITLGSLQNQTWEEIWFSDQYNAFRFKMESIHTEQFHLKDPEWSFCQQCPHMDINLKIEKALKPKLISKISEIFRKYNRFARSKF